MSKTKELPWEKEKKSAFVSQAEKHASGSRWQYWLIQFTEDRLGYMNVVLELVHTLAKHE